MKGKTMHSEGAKLIVEERTRQVEKEGYTTDHDLQHGNQLAAAALCYVDYYLHIGVQLAPIQQWPWDDEYWKPDQVDELRNLVKAGALIAAQIDQVIALGERLRPLHDPINLRDTSGIDDAAAPEPFAVNDDQSIRLLNNDC